MILVSWGGVAPKGVWKNAIFTALFQLVDCVPFSQLWHAGPLLKLRKTEQRIGNRIKKQFSVFADRASAKAMRADQLYRSAMAYALVCDLRRL